MALSVHPCCALLGVCTTGEDNVGKLSTEVTVVALVDDEGVLGDACGVDLVRVEEVDELGLGSGRLLGGDEANLVCRRARRSL